MKIIAHRGASAERPENSLAACERAIEIGVDAIEVDLLVTGDGQLVARHDDLIQHDGRWSYIHELRFDELHQIDLGAGERIPSLAQVFERVDGRCQLVLDLKTFGIAERLAAFLRARDVQRDVHVTSFLHAEVAAIGRLEPAVERSIALAAIPVTFDACLRDAGAQQVSLYRGYINEPMVRRLRDRGVRVWAYPVNVPREAAVLRSWGIEGIFTNDPAAMQPYRSPMPRG